MNAGVQWLRNQIYSLTVSVLLILKVAKLVGKMRSVQTFVLDLYMYMYVIIILSSTVKATLHLIYHSSFINCHILCKFETQWRGLAF